MTSTPISRRRAGFSPRRRGSARCWRRCPKISRSWAWTAATNAPIAEPDGAGRIQNFLADTARRLKIWIVGGTVPLRQDADGRVSAACLVYNADGQRAARYDKIHLFDVDVPGSTESHRESAHTVPGREPRVVDTPVGKLGLSVCYDMRFPELFRVMSRQGADLFVVPSAFTVPTGKAHWESLLRARAIENLCGADCARAMGRAPERARDIRRLDDHRSLGTGAGALAAKARAASWPTSIPRRAWRRARGSRRSITG